MAYLLHVHTTDEGNVGHIPDSLADSAWATGFNNAVNTTANFSPFNDVGTGCVVYFFKTEGELDTFLSALAVPAEHQATVDAWKTANSVSIEYNLYDLSTSSVDISGKSKY